MADRDVLLDELADELGVHRPKAESSVSRDARDAEALRAAIGMVVKIRDMAEELCLARLMAAVLESVAKRPWDDPAEAVAFARRALGLPERP